MHARVVLYKFKVGTVESAANKAETGLLPLFRKYAGFHSYEVIVAGKETVVSVSRWETEGQALEAAKAGGAWVKENLSRDLVSAETHVGEVMFSHKRE